MRAALIATVVSAALLYVSVYRPDMAVSALFWGGLTVSLLLLGVEIGKLEK